MRYNKKILIALGMVGILSLPIVWSLLAPYQKTRVLTLVSPYSDPSGAGYNSIQSKIAVGSGQLLGRGLGEGVQTQLAFLPERHTDFVFASISEEFGFLGTTIVMLLIFYMLFRIIFIIENSKNPQIRAFNAGVFLTLFAQTIVHIGMNMGMFPITGLPLPIVSAGGSSFLATMVMLGIVVNSKKIE